MPTSSMKVDAGLQVHAQRTACLVALLTLLTGAPARARDDDPWFGPDKRLHWGVSAGIAASSYGGAALFTPSRPARLAIGGGVALLVGTGKELYDLSGHGDASFRDLTWDLIGAATGVGIAWLIDLLISRPIPVKRAACAHAAPSPLR